MFDFGSPVRAEPVIVERHIEAKRHVEPERQVEAERRGDDPSEAGLLFRRLWRGSAYILLGGLGAVALGVMALNLVRPTYTANAQILIDPTDLPLVVNDLSSRQPAADSGLSIAESQARVIQSDSVLRRVVARLDLSRDEEFVPPPQTSPMLLRLKGVLGMEAPSGNRDPVEVALDSLRPKLAVRRAERTFVIDVYAQTRDPEKSARIANAVGEAYLAEEAQARADAARRASETLNARLAGLRRAVEEAERKVLQYREANKLVTASGRLLSDQQLSDLNQQLVTATLRTAEAKARLDQAQRMRAGEAGTALPEMLQSLEMQNLRQQYAVLSRNTAEIATRLGERHPAMAEQYAQQRDLQRLIQREKERIIATAQKEYDRVAATEAAVRRSLERAKTETTGNDRAAIGLRELQREAESRRAVYETFLKRVRETSEQERLNSANMRIISAATPPQARTWPPSPKLILPLALLIGLTLGAGMALLMGALRDRRGPRRPPAPPVRGARSFRAVDA